MIDPVVRRARGADAGALAALEAEARAALVDARGGARWLEEHPAVGPGWAAEVETGAVFVAVLSAPPTAGTDGVAGVQAVEAVEVVVGYLALAVDGGVARITQVFITPDARELGFGDALIDVATDAARDAGAAVIEGEALPGDRETKNLYERAGITARLITVSRRLDRPVPPRF
jgi:GNAT superfamily N-acetyltransferase